MTRLLVVIASYGQKNDPYLACVLAEYRSMSYQTDIVVLSNLPKALGPDIEVLVGLPEKNPMSLPFGHKRVFADRQDRYDLFLYTEDDMLISQRNIEAVLNVSRVLPQNELAGFFQWEQYPDGRRYFPAVHGHFHWRPESVKTAGVYTFAQFTNEHSACYLLTQAQLKAAIASGGYLVPPHEGKYTLLETATTDPYTQCGFQKVICISHFEDFLVAHLPNCYMGRLGLDGAEFYKQLSVLNSTNGSCTIPKPLLEPENKLFLRRWSKNYYEAVREDLISSFPEDVRSVLSIGCGWGATEAALMEKGVRVIGVPVDCVIAACAASRGVEIVCGDLESAVAQLSTERFDGVLLSCALHLMPDPVKTLRLAASLLRPGGAVVATLPNVRRLPFLWRRLRHFSRYRAVNHYERSGMHVVARRHARRWFSAAGLSVVSVVETVPPNWQDTVARTRGLAARLFSLEYTIVAHKRRTSTGSSEALPVSQTAAQ